MKTTHSSCRVLAFLLSVCMIVGMLPFTAIVTLAAEPTWSGDIDFAWYFGHEEDESYVIENGDDLAGLALLVNGDLTVSGEALTVDFAGKTLTLTQDINLDNRDWMPIGTYEHPFRGLFDGTGKVISNLRISNGLDGYAALFGRIEDSSIKNLSFRDVNLNASRTNATLVGSAENSLIENCTANNVRSLDGSVGGLLGFVIGGTVRNCHTENVNLVSTNGTQINPGQYRSIVGGLAIQVQEGTIVEDCTSSGYIRANGLAGGLIGVTTTELDSEDRTTVQNCSSAVDVQLSGEREYSNFAGGLIGTNGFRVLVEQCHATGNVTTNLLGTCAGGLMGSNNSTVLRCYATGNVTSTRSEATLGGLIGMNAYEADVPRGSNGDVKECYATGSVDASQSAICVAGGLIGQNETYVNDCYSTGRVSAGNGSRPEARAGALVGEQRPAMVNVPDPDNDEYKEEELDAAYVNRCYATGEVFVKKLGIGTSGRAMGLAASYEKGTIRNCVALSRSVEMDGNFITSGIAPGSYDEFTRVGSKTATLQNNYARSDMLVDGKSQSGNSDLNGRHGENILYGSAQDWGKWFGGDFSDVWDMTYCNLALYYGAPLPTLKHVGGSQNPIFLNREEPSGPDYSWYDPSSSSFTIRTVSQFSALANLVNGNTANGYVSFEGKTIYLDASYISLRGIENWEPIGKDKDHAFQGTFMGKGSSIIGLTTQDDNTNGKGLFGFTGNKAVIRDVNILGANIKGNRDMGILAAQNAGEITGCSVSGKITGGKSAQSESSIGGLVGMSAGLVDNCSASGTVELQNHAETGGLVGTFIDGVVRNSSANVSLTSQNASILGGLIGLAENGTIESCTAKGGSLTNGTPTRWMGMTGGLIGQIMKVTVSDCHTNGTIEIKNGNAGGLVGQANHNAVIKASTAGNRVTNSGTGTTDMSGGLVGENYGLIQDCYASGTVRMNRGTAGGLVSRNSGKIERSYAINWEVEAAGTAGGLVGVNKGEISHCVGMSFSVLNPENGFETTGAVAGENNGSISNCYARGDMIINHTVQPSDDAKNGIWIAYGSKLDWNAYFGDLTQANWREDRAERFEYGKNRELISLSNGSRHRIECILGSEGTSEWPYCIYEVQDLVHFRELVNKFWDFEGKTIQLERPLTMPEESWTPIAASSADRQTALNGAFNGNGYTIDNLQVDAQTHGGLFGIIGPQGSVHNLGLNAVSISSGGYAGGIAGENHGKIEACSVDGVVNGRAGFAGGIAGRQDGTILNSYTTARVSGTDFVGGIVGANAGTVKNTYATGRISGQNDVGGIVGENTATLANNMAFNSRVDASGNNGFAARIGKGAQANNFARSDMWINGEPAASGQESDGTPIEPGARLDWNVYFDRNLMGNVWILRGNYLNPGEPLPVLVTKVPTESLIPDAPTRVERPAFSKASGTYHGPQEVEITCGTEGATIFYTTDGTDPATSETRAAYSGPVSINGTVTLKAVAVKDGMDSSMAASAEYIIAYTLTVENGSDTTGGELYESGAQVSITADAPPEGYDFSQWTLSSGAGEFSDANSPETTFAMGAGDAVITASYKDVTPPTGEVAVADNRWSQFLNTITFGLFFRETQQVTITAADNSGEEPEIYYLLSETAFTPEEAAAQDGWMSYSGAISIAPDASVIVYARISDAAGNVAYLSSDGLVLDATAPEITGAEDGGTYGNAVQLTVTDAYLGSVTVNGENQEIADNTSQFTLEQDGEYTVTARDKADNETSLSVTILHAEITAVGISPESISVPPGTNRQFTAVVSGIGEFDQSVLWSVEGARSEATQISADGVLTVGLDETAGSFLVRATAKANQEVSCTATVTVTGAPGQVDKSILQRVIDKAEQLLGSEEFLNAISSVRESFRNTLEQAKAVNDDDNAAQQQVNEAWVSMLFEIHKLGLVQGNKDLLREHVELYGSLDLNAYVDNEAKETFIKALGAARAMLESDNEVQSEVDACDNALVAAARQLVKRADKETLSFLVAVASDYREEDYAKGWEEFAAALSAAREFLSSDDVTQEQLDQAADRLVNAMTELRYKADKELLQLLISQAEAIDPSGYSAEKLAAFASALDNARNIAADSTLSSDEQEKVDQAAQGLQMAIEVMVGVTGDSGGKSNSAKTGDNASPAIAVILLGACAGAVLTRKKNRKSR